MSSCENSNEKLTCFRRSQFSFQSQKSRVFDGNQVEKHQECLRMAAVFSPSFLSP